MTARAGKTSKIKEVEDHPEADREEEEMTDVSQVVTEATATALALTPVAAETMEEIAEDTQAADLTLEPSVEITALPQETAEMLAEEAAHLLTSAASVVKSRLAVTTSEPRD